MNQKELVKAVAADVNKKYSAEGKNVTVSESLTGDVIKSFATVTTNVLKKGDQIAIAGFGIFKSQKKAATTARNPATGATIKVPAKNVPKFKASKALKEALN